MRHFPPQHPSLLTPQPLRQCAYIILQVIGAPELPRLHEQACQRVSKILWGQNLLQGLSNYMPSPVPLRSPHHYFPAHGCICRFIFYGYEIMGQNRGVCSFLPSLCSSRGLVVTEQCFTYPQGGLWEG